MGLIDLKTNLKSLKYGNDQQGGGSSNQPFITTPIPEGYAPKSIDFLLRNGILNPADSIQDATRLTKFFASINGVLFTTKQIALERQNPKLVNTNRIYLPTSTILQAGVLSTGTHLNKQGLNPFQPLSYFSGGTTGYYFSTKGIGENPVFQTLLNGDVENRLTIAYTAKIADQSLGTLAINPFGITTFNPNVLLSYSGGPNADLGLGDTNIRIQNPTIKLKDVYEDGASKAKTIYNNPNVVSALKGQNFLSHKMPTWVYNPSYGGVSFQYQVEAGENGVDDAVLYDSLYTSNISNILNKNNIAIYNKPFDNDVVPINYINTTDPSKPGYLTPKRSAGGIAPTNNYNIDQIMSVGASQTYFELYKDQLGEGGGFSLLTTGPKETIEKNSATAPTQYPEYNDTVPIDYINTDDPSKPGYLTPKRSTGGIAPTNNYNIDQIMSVGASQAYFELYKDQLGEGGEFNLLTAGPKETIEKNSATAPTKYPEYIEEVSLPTNINWVYNPSDEINNASSFYIDDAGLNEEAIYTDNVSNVLNRTSNTLFNADKPSTELYGERVYAYSGEQIINQGEGNNENNPNDPKSKIFSKTKSTTLSNLTDYRKIIKNNDSEATSLPSTNYNKFNRETTYRTSRTNYEPTPTVDEINNLPVTSSVGNNVSKDIIKFYFELIGNNSANSFLFFRAYLNSLSDAFSPQWDSYKYVGRAENFYKYNGFSRDISLDFTIYGHTRTEMKPIYEKLNRLVGSTAPDYSSNLMKGNFIKLTIGDYLSNVPGFIKNITLTPSFEAGWDINRGENGELLTVNNTNIGQVPKLINVSLGFTPIHSFTPTNTSTYIRNI
jgi:hypothetical protein